MTNDDSIAIRESAASRSNPATASVPDYGIFSELPITAIHPRGWLDGYLRRQRDGLTGHLEVAGRPFGIIDWHEGHERNDYLAQWEPYEQTAYWVDGMIRAGLLLGDEFLINKARLRTRHVLAHPDVDGYLGPPMLKTKQEFTGKLAHYRKRLRWPHAVFFRALMAEHGADGKAGIAQAVAQHYLSDTYDHYENRDVLNVESMLWAYRETGDGRLLTLAQETFARFEHEGGLEDCSPTGLLAGDPCHAHGVTFNEMAKLGALIYRETGEQRLLAASVAAIQKLERDCLLVSGVCSSSEHLRGKDPLDSHETCDISDQSWTLGALLMATGDAHYGDLIERACLNAGPGAVSEDFKALQYFSCPNQVVADRRSNHNQMFHGLAQMSYRPKPGTLCCPGNVHRFMPNYVARMWMRHRDGGVAAVCYGPSEVCFVPHDGAPEVRIEQETDYPFREIISFRIRTSGTAHFALHLRIPAWCHAPQLSGDGIAYDHADPRPGTFVRIERTFADGDVIRLHLPMPLRNSHWPHGGISIERGPLAYSLRIAEDRQRDVDDERSSDAFPAWNITATSAWNYALAVAEDTLAAQVKVIDRPMADNPWAADQAPIELQVPARRLQGWKLERCDFVDRTIGDGEGNQRIVRRESGDYRFTPQLPDPACIAAMADAHTEVVTLVPYGCTTLRLTVFPHCPPTDQ